MAPGDTTKPASQAKATGGDGDWQKVWNGISNKQFITSISCQFSLYQGLVNLFWVIISLVASHFHLWRPPHPQPTTLFIFSWGWLLQIYLSRGTNSLVFSTCLFSYICSKYKLPPLNHFSVSPFLVVFLLLLRLRLRVLIYHWMVDTCIPVQSTE